jgi:CHAT domain-containing protein
LILAQPEFTLPGYQPLPHVRLEANTIREIAGETVEIWPSANMNQAALSQAALAGDLSQYDWLHIATHSYVEPATGTFAGLVLGSDVLKLEDIHRWQLNARLVTLSACQTGLGRWYYGDELAGLSQAFLGAGVQTVIASLWLAADQQTADFMAILYRHLRQVSDPITALAQAQREAQRSGLAPYYWAPFCVFGRP